MLSIPLSVSVSVLYLLLAVLWIMCLNQCVCSMFAVSCVEHVWVYLRMCLLLNMRMVVCLCVCVYLYVGPVGSSEKHFRFPRFKWFTCASCVGVLFDVCSNCVIVESRALKMFEARNRTDKPVKQTKPFELVATNRNIRKLTHNTRHTLRRNWK